jgi:hypothetical protein
VFGSLVAFLLCRPKAEERFGEHTQRGKIKMSIRNIDKSHAHDKVGHYALPLFIAFVFALAICPTRTHAQIIGGLQVDVPFQFHAGDTKLPAGRYTIHPLDTSDDTIMEISSADGSTSALFEVEQADANSAPAKTELVFNKYGNRYFLTKLFDSGNPYGSQVAKSRYEQKLGRATLEAQEHVPATRQDRAGN